MNENARARVFAAGSKGKDEKVRERRCGGASGEGCFPFTGTPGYRRDFFRLIARHPPPPFLPTDIPYVQGRATTVVRRGGEGHTRAEKEEGDGAILGKR